MKICKHTNVNRNCILDGRGELYIRDRIWIGIRAMITLKL